MIKTYWMWLFVLCLPMVAMAGEANQPPLPHKMDADLHDKASLQRGARLYVNYCASCHSLQYMRYARMAKDIGIVAENGEILTEIVTANLIFTEDKIFETMHTTMPKAKARHWFGVEPPDLSLITRVRGINWLYNYLLGFYNDPRRPLGVNNTVFPDVGMPNVLLPLQGEQEAIYRVEKIHVAGEATLRDRQVIDHLELKTLGSMDSVQFDDAVRDLVNFLAYVGEPAKLQREQLGIWVLAFMFIFIVLAFWLKVEYWKDIKKK